jgi:hypothetical protein
MVGSNDLGVMIDHVYPVISCLTLILIRTKSPSLWESRLSFKTDVIINHYARQDAGEKISYGSI